MDSTDSQEILSSIVNDCLAVRVRLINRVITSVYDDALRPHGIKASQVNILVAVSAFGPVKHADVCRVLHLDPSTLSRNVERMKNRGWLETIPGKDGRTHLLRTLPEGLAIIQRMYPDWRRAQEKAASILGEKGVETVSEVAGGLLGLG